MPKVFPSKILLFGEYTILNGSSALAVPLQQFFGKWIPKDGPEINRKALIAFANFLLAKEFKFLDTNKLIYDLNNGLNFESNIPIGYGMGSSGSVSAAIYSSYKIETQNDQSLSIYRDELSQMENFFHGNSSGLDPLVSYLNKAILKTPDNQFKKVDELKGIDGIDIFLLDTKQSRSTAPLVKKYKASLEDKNFKSLLESNYIYQVELSIKAFINADKDSFFESLDQISDFQYHHFKDMILEKNGKAWTEALDTDFCRLKLCGAGGGGYILGFSKNNEKTKELLGEVRFVEI